MATLFEIDKAIAEFEWEIDKSTGEVLNPYGLDELQMARDEKCENIALLIKNKEAEQKAVCDQEKIYADRKKVLGNEIERLKDYLAYALQGEKFSTPRVVVSYRKSESVNIPDDTALKNEWCSFTTVRKPNKTAIKTALKRGEEVFGAELVTKQNIQVK